MPLGVPPRRLFLFRWCQTVATTRRIPIDNSNADIAKEVVAEARDIDEQCTGDLARPQTTNRLGSKPGDGMRRDRAILASTQLYQLAITEQIHLTQDELSRISPDYLFVLAITKNFGLSQQDKNRLRPLHLAHLAVTGTVDLSHEDKARLPTELLFELFVEGVLSLTQDEKARFTVGQLEQLKDLGSEYSESLVSL
jgi:hypothetical protein